jgi:hypothetical protein
VTFCSVMNALFQWLLTCPQIDTGYHDALIALATVSSVLFTGVLILRQLPKVIYIAAELFGFAFLAPIFALTAKGCPLKFIAFLLFLYYCTWLCLNIKSNMARRGRTPVATWTQEFYYTATQLCYTGAILYFALRPSNVFAAGASAVALYAGFQILLRKLLQRPSA